MREIFQKYALKGAMTKEELAQVLNLRPEAVRRMAKAGKIPRIPGLKAVRFDPEAMIALYCEPPKPKARSLTIERHKTSERSKGGFLECL